MVAHAYGVLGLSSIRSPGETSYTYFVYMASCLQGGSRLYTEVYDRGDRQCCGTHVPVVGSSTRRGRGERYVRISGSLMRSTGVQEASGP